MIIKLTEHRKIRSRGLINELIRQQEHMKEKIRINSTYGALGTNSFPFYDNKVAEKITNYGNTDG